MKCILRSIKLARWLDKKTDDLSSKELEEIFADLKTEDNALSIFIVNSDDDIKSVIIGLTSSRKHLGNFTGISLEYDDFLSLNLNLIQTPGETPLNEANELHQDISVLNSDDIKKLALMLHSKGQKIIHGKTYVKNLLNDPEIKSKLILENMDHEMHLKLDLQCTCE